MAKETPYLDVQNLTKSFGALTLFEDISFSIAEGKKVGLIAKTVGVNQRYCLLYLGKILMIPEKLFLGAI